MTRHSAGQKDRQFPLVGLPARALRCVPRHREERAQRPAHACSPGGKGTRAGLATRHGRRDASPWRKRQPYGALGRCRLSGAAAGPHCRATRPRLPPSTAPAALSPNPQFCLPFVVKPTEQHVFRLKGRRATLRKVPFSLSSFLSFPFRGASNPRSDLSPFHPPKSAFLALISLLF